jgi:hypothetical protein
MNRQAGPSIVLSISIVCFFAVALFQHDAPRSARARSGFGETKLSPRVATVTDDVHGKRPTESPEFLRPPTVADARRNVAARSAVESETASTAQVPQAPARSHGAGESALIVATGLKATDSVDPVREPISAFTVVRANETIRDVAIRVYGSNQHVGTLWRANRDSLPRLNSPLSSGVVLRTPSVQ